MASIDLSPWWIGLTAILAAVAGVAGYLTAARKPMNPADISAVDRRIELDVSAEVAKRFSQIVEAQQAEIERRDQREYDLRNAIRWNREEATAAMQAAKKDCDDRLAFLSARIADLEHAVRGIADNADVAVPKPPDVAAPGDTETGGTP